LPSRGRQCFYMNKVGWWRVAGRCGDEGLGVTDCLSAESNMIRPARRGVILRIMGRGGFLPLRTGERGPVKES
jgi:hypothetical protein